MPKVEKGLPAAYQRAVAGSLILGSICALSRAYCSLVVDYRLLSQWHTACMHIRALSTAYAGRAVARPALGPGVF